jgi:hypothetical protein
MSKFLFVSIEKYFEKRHIHHASMPYLIKKILTNTTKSILEVLNNKKNDCKLYLDVEKVQSLDQFNDFMHDFINYLEKMLGIKLQNQVAVTYNPNSVSHPGLSFHVIFQLFLKKEEIVYSNFKYNGSQGGLRSNNKRIYINPNILLVKDFIIKNPKYKDIVDTSIYNRNRLFRTVFSYHPSYMKNGKILEKNLNSYHKPVIMNYSTSYGYDANKNYKEYIEDIRNKIKDDYIYMCRIVEDSLIQVNTDHESYSHYGESCIRFFNEIPMFELPKELLMNNTQINIDYKRLFDKDDTKIIHKICKPIYEHKDFKEKEEIKKDKKEEIKKKEKEEIKKDENKDNNLEVIKYNEIDKIINENKEKTLKLLKNVTQMIEDYDLIDLKNKEIDKIYNKCIDLTTIISIDNSSNIVEFLNYEKLYNKLKTYIKIILDFI